MKTAAIVSMRHEPTAKRTRSTPGALASLAAGAAVSCLVRFVAVMLAVASLERSPAVVNKVRNPTPVTPPRRDET